MIIKALSLLADVEQSTISWCWLILKEALVPHHSGNKKFTSYKRSHWKGL